MKRFRIDVVPSVLSFPASVESELVALGYQVVDGGGVDVRPEYNRYLTFDKPAAGAYFCPPEPLDTSIETIKGVMYCKGLLALSDFQEQQLRKTFPFLPDNFIKRVPLGHHTVPAAKKEQLIVCGKGSDLGVAEDIFNRVSQKVPDVMMVGGTEAARWGSSLPRAKVWLYTGADERMPLAPLELLEAQSAGAIPVCVGTGAIPEYVVRGFFYKPPVTSEAFKAAAAKRIIELLTDESSRLSVATSHQRRLNALHWSEVIDDWAEL